MEDVEVAGCAKAKEETGELGFLRFTFLTEISGDDWCCCCCCCGVDELTTGGGEIDEAADVEFGGESATENFLLRSSSRRRFLTSRPSPISLELPVLLPPALSADGDSGLLSHRALSSSRGKSLTSSTSSLVMPSSSSSSSVSPKL